MNDFHISARMAQAGARIAQALLAASIVFGMVLVFQYGYYTI